MRLFVPLSVGLVLSTVALATAHGDEPAGRWHVAVEGTTEMPLSMGGRLTFETPGRVRLAVGLGVLPLPYVATLNQALLAAGAYDPRFGGTLSDTLTGSLVARGQFGWRPWYDRGWYFSAGYSSVSLGSSTSVLGQVSGLLDRVPPELDKYIDAYASDYVSEDRAPTYALDTTLHMLTFEVGHQWLAFDRLIVRWAIGFGGTFAANVAIEPEAKGYSEDDVLAQFARDAEERLNELFTTYGFIPMISFGVGYRFEGPEAADD